MIWFALSMLGIFALPLLALLPWERLSGSVMRRRWQHDPYDPRPRMVRCGDGYELDRGL
ncbi:hypothetical protein [Haloechinothrix sp. LS1_15]|uniref:hypothetical protein n=1 Tax=Haloechinothrix sp. LS1_15 TaxID=2652248 RepID=UPI00294B9642|nr:hypothetical protein [Haloechinothrix sp. LS1_15]